jgi:hypothetical protein
MRASPCEDAPSIEFLREGDSIGFDVGWTSKGLRITSIRPAGRPADQLLSCRESNGWAGHACDEGSGVCREVLARYHISMHTSPLVVEAIQQFAKASDLRRQYASDLSGEAARGKAIELATISQKLRPFFITLARRTEPGEPISSADSGLLAPQTVYPDAPDDFCERLEGSLLANESSSPELSEASQSILLQLGKDISPGDRDLVSIALRKLDAIQPVASLLKRKV